MLDFERLFDVETCPLTKDVDTSGVLVGSAGTTSTANADTFTSVNTATTSTYGTGDVLLGGDGLDVLNITADNVALGAATSVVGIETINVTAVGSGIVDAASFNAGGVVGVGTTINVKNQQSVNGTGFTITALATGATVAADAGITGTLSVTTAASTSQTVTLAANKAGTQTLVLTGTAGTDTATVSAAGTIGTNTAGGSQIETVNFSGNGAAAIYTIAGAATTYNLTGVQSVTLSGNESSFDGKTITDSTTAGTTTLKITTSANSDLSKAAVDMVELAADGDADTYVFRNGQNVKISTAVTTADVTFDIDDQTTAHVNGAITVDLGVAFTTGVGIAVTATSLTSDNISTLNLINDTVAQTALEVLATADTAVVLSGSKAVVLETTSTAKSVTQTGSGALTVNYDNTANIATATGGAGNDTFTNANAAIGTEVTINGLGGNDTFTMLTAAKAVIDGGEGTDTLILAGSVDATALKLSNIEVVSLTGTGVADFTASQLSGKTYIFTGDAAAADTIEINAALSIDTTTIDLSKLVIDTTNVTSVKVDGTAISAAFGVGSVQTFTGSIVADTYIGNQGADVITTGEGADIITGGLGADAINLTEVTAVIDSVNLTGGLTADTITGFKTGAGGDKILLGLTALKTAGAIEAGVTTTMDLLVDGTTAITAAAAGIQEVADQAGGAAVAAGAAKNVFILLEETYANLGALETGLETGDHELTAHAGASVHDSFIVVWSDGTDTHVSNVRIAVDNADFAAADLVAIDLAIIKGTGTITASEFHVDNFAFA